MTELAFGVSASAVEPRIAPLQPGELDGKLIEIELPVVVGQYQTVAYYQNSLKLRLHDGNPGLLAR